ncbi:phosphopantetheine-binding protein [Granulosicoccus sp.]|jgi:acyl carrier protein|nr:phosphopantetheine-binding protein [Granulosicoccus sp.]MDB4223790.1 phosphopantetheine-binding protein [Granulosicoccus sp.]
MKMQEQVYEIIKNLKPNVPDFDVETSLQEAEILDSVAMLEFVLWIEEAFELVVDTDDLTPENFSTLGNIVAYIESQVSQA